MGVPSDGMSGQRGPSVAGVTALYGILAVIGIALAAIVGVAATGGSDTTPLVTTIIGLVVPIVGVLLTLLRVEQVHKVVNSAATEQRRVNEAQAIEIAELKAALVRKRTGEG